MELFYSVRFLSIWEGQLDQMHTLTFVRASKIGSFLAMLVVLSSCNVERERERERERESTEESSEREWGVIVAITWPPPCRIRPR